MGTFFRQHLCNYWYEVGTKFDEGGTKFDELGTKYNPEVIKYIPEVSKYTPGGAWRRRGVYLVIKLYIWSLWDYISYQVRQIAYHNR